MGNRPGDHREINENPLLNPDAFRYFLENRTELSDEEKIQYYYTFLDINKGRKSNSTANNEKAYHLTYEWINNQIKERGKNPIFRRVLLPWIAYSIIPKLLFTSGIVIGTIWAIYSLSK